MSEGMFGLPIKPPGALYWFNVSLLLMVLTSFYALSSGSFPGVFVVIALALMGTMGMKWPLKSAQVAIKDTKWFLVYTFCLLSMCNLLDHVFHKTVSFPGVMCVILSGVVGFFLGRYACIGRFGLEEPPASKDDGGVTTPKCE